MTTEFCDAWTVRCQACVYLPSCRPHCPRCALTGTKLYCLVVVWTTCLRLLPKSTAVRTQICDLTITSPGHTQSCWGKISSAVERDFSVSLVIVVLIICHVKTIHTESSVWFISLSTLWCCWLDNKKGIQPVENLLYHIQVFSFGNPTQSRL